MTPEQLARLHAAAFDSQRPWSAREFAELMASASVFLTEVAKGFALGRVAADEAEVLTLAVAPAARRKGLGLQLVEGFEATARQRGASTAFLEVAEDNAPAIALYRAAGYVETGRRPSYYRRPDKDPVAAVTMRKPLTLR